MKAIILSEKDARIIREEMMDARDKEMHRVKQAFSDLLFEAANDDEKAVADVIRENRMRNVKDRFDGILDKLDEIVDLDGAKAVVPVFKEGE